ncbi:hypothetical protein RFI_18063 [Reticulomyxa filosa]|uniref:Uncharacterized protein n=1 Tax=Reticulomyxa filosa TaxID=46433 RepID=X6N1H1_RETFI|nr:hypothetical protein RFI_18063 [Reticulomyxa filosa]|eukprot:ETO19172.1 hypothetical protein RFI_18063 [Reticulomyxa filosa]
MEEKKNTELIQTFQEFWRFYEEFHKDITKIITDANLKTDFVSNAAAIENNANAHIDDNEDNNVTSPFAISAKSLDDGNYDPFPPISPVNGITELYLRLRFICRDFFLLVWNSNGIFVFEELVVKSTTFKSLKPNSFLKSYSDSSLRLNFEAISQKFPKCTIGSCIFTYQQFFQNVRLSRRGMLKKSLFLSCLFFFEFSYYQRFSQSI